MFHNPGRSAPRAAAILGVVALVTGTAAGDPSSIRFTDVGAASGVHAVLEHSPSGEKHLVETMAGGLAVFDYDGDGRLDLYFANGAELPSLEKREPRYWNRLYRNDGQLAFTDVTAAAGVAGAGFSMGVAVGDYDNDGRPDLFVAGVPRNVLYRNLGGGRFEDVTSSAGIGSDAWGLTGAWLDYDRDGQLDLFLVNYLRWSPAMDRFCGDRARAIRVYCHPRYFEGLPNRLYRNRGDGTFEDVSAASGIGRHTGKGMSAAVADFDGDGRSDVYVTNDTLPSFQFRNRGDGTFEETGLLAGTALPAHGRPISAMGVDARDADNDGRVDIVVTALAGETFPFYRNEGVLGFRDATATSGLGAAVVRRSGWGVALADLDNDGWRDLATANSHVNDRIEAFESTLYRLPGSIFRNSGGGRFADVSRDAGAPLQDARAWRGLAVADLDVDGRLDIVQTALGQAPALWRNVTDTAGRHWIGLRLVGTRSARDAVGAVVRIGARTDHVSTAASYASSVHAWLHFGVETPRVPRIEIVWPSGRIQVLEDVPAGRVVTVEEPR